MATKIKKELREWIILITVSSFIYLMGWHTVVIGKIQQLVLYSGLFQPSELKEDRVASYDFVIEDMEGTKVPFSEFKGKTVFINFWATWCPPCIAEMPDIHSLYDEVGSEVEFVMISLDQEEEKARKFVANRNFEFPVYFLRSRLPASYDTHAIPTTYLLDQNGKIHIENHGMAKYNTKSFKKLLAELSAKQAVR